MSLMMTAVRLVAKVWPDRKPDPLIHARDIIGTELSRVDGAEKVTGAARFTTDVALTGMTYGALVCSDVPAGRIAAIDTARAEREPGVLLVLTHRNAPPMKPAPTLLTMKGAALTLAPIMRDDLVRWNGEPVAFVVAETREQAEHAATLVDVTYEPAPARLDYERLRSGAVRPKNVLTEPAAITRGRVDAAIADADVVVDHVYRTPRENHAAIEPHATTVEWHGDDHLTVYDASQAISHSGATFAAVFGLDAANVRVLAPQVGGAFGNKMVWNHQILCVAAAKLCRRPVQLALSRADVFRTTGGRTLSEQRVVLAARGDGTLRALVHTGLTTTGIKNGYAEQFTFPARQLYGADTYRIEQKIVELNTVANTTMRAPGESIGLFALESAMDELAIALDLDPVELRRRVEPAKDWAKGTAFSNRNLIEAYRIGAERFGWREHRAAPRTRRDGEWWIGTGVASATYPYSRFPGTRVGIRLTADGRAVVRSAVQDMGMGTATVQVQCAAERLGLPVDHVTFEYGDTDLPKGIPAGGSAQTASLVEAAGKAAAALVKKLLSLVDEDSPLAGARPADVEARDGGLYRTGEDTGESYVSLLKRADREVIESEGTGSMPFEMMKHAMHSYGAHFCEVRVNDVTGEVRVSRWIGAFDTGRILNATTAASQFRGGIIMGIGMALTEETLFDERTGRILNPSLAEYHVPVHADVPDIDVIWTGIPDPLAPAGAKGVGEIGVTGVAAAIANAVHNATGLRVRDLPITPDKILTTRCGGVRRHGGSPIP